MGRLPALWADPEAFRPERHLGKPKPSSFIFTAFQVRQHAKTDGRSFFFFLGGWSFLVFFFF